MAFKETKRKGFNFFRSYYDVFNELPEADKLPFITALLDRQFQGVKPTNLKGMAKFAWISQVNSIDSQVKGFEDKTGIKLHPTVGGVERVENTPSLQVEVEEEEKEKEEVKDNTSPAKAVAKIDFDKLLIFINKTTGRNFKTINTKTKNSFKARLKEGYTNLDIQTAILNSVKDKYHIENNFKWLKPEYYSRSNTLDLHSNINKTPIQGLSMAEQLAGQRDKVAPI